MSESSNQSVTDSSMFPNSETCGPSCKRRGLGWTVYARVAEGKGGFERREGFVQGIQRAIASTVTAPVQRPVGWGVGPRTWEGFRKLHIQDTLSGSPSEGWCGAQKRSAGGCAQGLPPCVQAGWMSCALPGSPGRRPLSPPNSLQHENPNVVQGHKRVCFVKLLSAFVFCGFFFFLMRSF